MTAMSASRRLYVALAASATLHVLVVALAWRILPMAPTYTSPVVFPITLVGAPGDRGGEGPGAAAELAAPAPPAAAPAPAPSPRRPARHATRRAPPAASPTEPAIGHGADGNGIGSTGAGGGGETGAGSGGGGGAGDGLVAYGTNPAPPYPLVARRLGMEGVVLLEVWITPEGRAGAVRVVQSSGHAPLDDAALRTVRETWRFVPATRDGRPVESRVTVPIRFRLTDDRG